MTFTVLSLHILAVIAAAISAFVEGALWNSPLLFGNARIKLAGLDPATEMKVSPAKPLAELVRCLVVAFVLAQVLRIAGIFGTLLRQQSDVAQGIVLRPLCLEIRGEERRRGGDEARGHYGNADHVGEPLLQGVVHLGRATIHPAPRTFLIESAPSFFRMPWIRKSTELLSTCSSAL